MTELNQLIQKANLAVIREGDRLMLLQLPNLKLVEVHLNGDESYSIQEVTRGKRNDGDWDISLDNIAHQIDYLQR